MPFGLLWLFSWVFIYNKIDQPIKVRHNETSSLISFEACTIINLLVVGNIMWENKEISELIDQGKSCLSRSTHERHWVMYMTMGPNVTQQQSCFLLSFWVLYVSFSIHKGNHCTIYITRVTSHYILIDFTWRS